MHDPTFEKLVARLRPDYGIHAEAVALQIIQAHRHFGATTIRRVVAGK